MIEYKSPESADRNTEERTDELRDPGHLRELLGGRKAFKKRGANGDALFAPSENPKPNNNKADSQCNKADENPKSPTRGREERKGEGRNRAVS